MIIRKKKLITPILLVALLITAIVGFGLYFYFANNSSSNTVSDDGIDYSPATRDDEALNDSIKQNLGNNDGKEDDENTSEQLPSEKKPVTPVISAWGQPSGPGTDLKLNGYAPGIIEDDGTCTLTLTKGGAEASTTKTALVNAQNTSCGQLVISFSKLSPGTWSAVLSYNSPHSAGSSKVTVVEVK